MCGCAVNAYLYRLGSGGKYKMFICLDYGHTFTEGWLKFSECGFYKRLMSTVNNTSTKIRVVGLRELKRHTGRKKKRT